MKINNYGSTTHYVLHILKAQAALDSWCTAHWKFSLIFVALTASQNCSCPQTDKVLVLQHKFVSESCTFILCTLKLKHFLSTCRFPHPLTLVNSSKHCLTRRQNSSLNRGILLGDSSTPNTHLTQASSSSSLRPVMSSHRPQFFLMSNLISHNNIPPILFIQQAWCHDSGVCFHDVHRKHVPRVWILLWINQEAKKNSRILCFHLGKILCFYPGKLLNSWIFVSSSKTSTPRSSLRACSGEA